MPNGAELELRTGALEEELRALAEEGVQSLLLEGGPTIADSFLREDFVDKLFVFVAPRLGGEGIPFFLPESTVARKLSRLHVEAVGEDVLLTAYVREP